MDRLALFAAAFLSLLLALNGGMTSAPIAARKGYNPRLGALAGALTGLLGGLIPALVVRQLSGAGGLVVLAALIGGAGALALLWRLIPARDAQQGVLPSGASLGRNIVARHTRGAIAQALFILSIAVALLALGTLLWTILNRTVGLTAVQYNVEPGALTLASFDPGAAPGEVALADIPALLAEHVHPVRLRELVLEQAIGAEPQIWTELEDQPLSAALKGRSFPAEWAATPLSALEPAQAADLLARNLDAESLQTLLYAEAGRPLSLMSAAEIAARLAEGASAERLQRLILARVTGVRVDDGAVPSVPVAQVLDGYAYPEALADILFDQLTAAESAALLVATLERADLEGAVLEALGARGLGDLSGRELGAIAAANVRKALLKVAILREVVGAAKSAWPDLSGQPLGVLLKGKDFPAELAETSFSQITGQQAAAILARNLDRDALIALLMDRVVQAQVVRSWPLWDSLTGRDAIETAQQAQFPRAELQWRSWVSADFLTSPLDPRRPDLTGIRPALLGSLLIIAITILVAFPVGVGAAIYLEEYAGRSRFNQVIQTNINNLAGVPSIIYGMLGLAIFVRSLEAITSGRVVGSGAANGRTVLSAGFTLALLILPLIIINAQEAIRAVPGSLRQASYGLGATRWQTIWHHVLPYAMPGILTGTILAVSRAIGETAPLILIGGATFLTRDPEGPFSIFTALPLLIYRWTALPQDEFRHAAAAAIIVLLALLLGLNSLAIILRSRLSRRLS
ncbi:MAG: phosphate ABC transporter permease PstA [Anaerolineae bacterium]|nr:phosphate ABC transporter permease PstA [Anaerolineae bacterium]